MSTIVALLPIAMSPKLQNLVLKRRTLKAHGAVSQECALEMALGALKRSDASVAIATTGIAGPTGGSEEKPVGLSYIAWAGPGFTECRRYELNWDRNQNRVYASYEAVFRLIRLISNIKV